MLVNINIILGNTLDSDQALGCSPVITNADLRKNVSWNGTSLDPKAIASPCGYIGKVYLIPAYTYFNDTFSLSKNGVAIPID